MIQGDVIVIGSGFSGCAAAITAGRAGHRVILLEKAPHPGGISICSGGGLRVADDAGEAFRYLKATNAGKTPDDVLLTLAEGMAKLEERVRRWGSRFGAVLARRNSQGNYPFPGFRTFSFVAVEEIPGVDPETLFPHMKGGPQSKLLYWMLSRELEELGIEPYFNCEASSLIMENGTVCGVMSADGREFRAPKVILACGGFEASPAMQDQYWPGGAVYSAAYRYNTGDGIRMAQAVGADLWHMWHYHGTYGFEPPEEGYPYGIRIKRLPDWTPGEDSSRCPRMAWILLDRSGRRFFNEYEPYSQDTSVRALELFSPETQDYPRRPCWLVTDARGLAMYPLGKPLYNDASVTLDWSHDNSLEVEKGWIHRADSLSELAERIGLPADAVECSVARWNMLCEQGNDEDFNRPPTSLHPLLEGPFYAAPMYPIVSNTHGGPRRDSRQRVLTPQGQPIPGLYAVGECGSSFGHLYISGGNVSECFISGRIAALD